MLHPCKRKQRPRKCEKRALLASRICIGSDVYEKEK